MPARINKAARQPDWHIDTMTDGCRGATGLQGCSTMWTVLCGVGGVSMGGFGAGSGCGGGVCLNINFWLRAQSQKYM